MRRISLGFGIEQSNLSTERWWFSPTTLRRSDLFATDMRRIGYLVRSQASFQQMCSHV
jgi:hypothetical protein